MRDYVAIQSRTASRAADGDITHTWATDSSVWANIEPTGSIESVDGDRVEGTTRCRITIRYIDGLVPAQRVLHGTDVYRILGITWDHKRCYQFLDTALIADSATAVADVGRQYSLDFDGVNDYVGVPTTLIDAAFHDSGGATDRAFTIAAWVKMTDATRFRILSTGASGDYGILYTMTAGDAQYFSLNSTDGFQSNDIIATGTSTHTAKQGAWAHFAVTYDGGGAKEGITLYANGSEDASTLSSHGSYTDLNRPAGESARIGSAVQLSSYATGRIADLAVIGKECSAAEISELYTTVVSATDFSASASNKAWYTFGDDDDDDATGTTGQITDVVAGTYNATPFNTTADDIVEDAPS
jgi:head-tail adaptor